MPALLRITWDIYWLAMDMSQSSMAHAATEATKVLFQKYHEKPPSTKMLLTNLNLYQKLSTLASKLIQYNYTKIPIRFNDGLRMYDSRWFDTQMKKVDGNNN